MSKRKFFFGVLILLLAVGCLCACGDKNDFKKGKVTGNTYKNEFAELEFEKPDSWVFASESELNEIRDASLEVSLGKQNSLTDALMEQKVILDMQATTQSDAESILNGASVESVAISFENLSLSIGGTKFTADEYLDISVEQQEKMYADIKDGSITVSTDEVKDYTIGSHTYRGCVITLRMAESGLEINQCICIRKVGKYMTCVAIAKSNSDDFDDIFRRFK